MRGERVHLRASLINGCSYCVNMHSHELKKAGEADERIFAVAGFVGLHGRGARGTGTEAATRISDRPDPVPDDGWKDGRGTTTSPRWRFNIAMINFWNRINVTIRQVSGSAY